MRTNGPRGARRPVPPARAECSTARVFAQQLLSQWGHPIGPRRCGRRIPHGPCDRSTAPQESYNNMALCRTFSGIRTSILFSPPAAPAL